MKKLILVLPILLTACVRAPVVTSCKVEHHDRVVHMSTGYDIDVPEGWVRIPNGHSDVKPSYEEAAFGHPNGAAVKITSTNSDESLALSLAHYGEDLAMRRGYEVGEVTFCQQIENAIEMSMSYNNVTYRVILIKGDKYLYMIEAFSALPDESGAQAKSINQFLSRVRVSK